MARMIDMVHRDTTVGAVDHSQTVPQRLHDTDAALALTLSVFTQIAEEMLVMIDLVLGDALGQLGKHRLVSHSAQGAVIARRAHFNDAARGHLASARRFDPVLGALG